MRNIVLALLAFVLLLAGCSLADNNLGDRKQDGNIEYLHDSRTQLCFARLNYTVNSGIEMVPCSPQVLQIAGEIR